MAIAHLDILPDGTGWAIANSPTAGTVHVYRTHDSGRSWTPVDGLPSGRPLFLRVIDDSTALLGWPEALYATGDGGITWRHDPMPAF
jgi:photosystem II stability/assembly factor-like uncharacterized protein